MLLLLLLLLLQQTTYASRYYPLFQAGARKKHISSSWRSFTLRPPFEIYTRQVLRIHGVELLFLGPPLLLGLLVEPAN
ncbi:hypothetical protein F4778DRAFT_733597 [Xylariomycetidae sp. FL2044]|nr:hypothetical protein F4778DRAFT_733597 [Xylariomycetidae sp. FL2044]